MFTKYQNRKSLIYNKLRDFRESLQHTFDSFLHQRPLLPLPPGERTDSPSQNQLTTYYVTDISATSGSRQMTTDAVDYFNSHSALRGLASRLALHARRGIYARFVSLAGTAPGQRLLDLGVTPGTGLPDSNFLERWYPHRRDITMAS